MEATPQYQIALLNGDSVTINETIVKKCKTIWDMINILQCSDEPIPLPVENNLSTEDIINMFSSMNEFCNQQNGCNQDELYQSYEPIFKQKNLNVKTVLGYILITNFLNYHDYLMFLCQFVATLMNEHENFLELAS
jgi:hypothetical protein